VFAATLPIMVSVAVLPIVQVGPFPCIDKRCTTLMIHSRQFIAFRTVHVMAILWAAGGWFAVLIRGRLLAAGLRVS
jgi:hypothetical protein